MDNATCLAKGYFLLLLRSIRREEIQLHFIDVFAFELTE